MQRHTALLDGHHLARQALATSMCFNRMPRARFCQARCWSAGPACSRAACAAPARRRRQTLCCRCGRSFQSLLRQGHSHATRYQQPDRRHALAPDSVRTLLGRAASSFLRVQAFLLPELHRPSSADRSYPQSLFLCLSSMSQPKAPPPPVAPAMSRCSYCGAALSPEADALRPV